MRLRMHRLIGALVPLAMLLTAVPAGADSQTGDELDLDASDGQITIELNNSTAGGSYWQTFDVVYDATTDDGTPVHVLVPEGTFDEAGDFVATETTPSVGPQFDPNPDDALTPCEERTLGEYTLSMEQIDTLGDMLTEQIVAVDEEHFGPMGKAVSDGGEYSHDGLFTLVYNIEDDFYYDCDVTSYTAGYFAPDFIADYGMNTIVIDTFDWANRVGDQADNPDGRSYLYEGVIAHELEHLLHNYSDPDEDSWVDEGLADFAGFINGFDVGGSHIIYQQVFHRETSLTRWMGGLENYGASYSFFQYLWEQAGGNGADAGADPYASDQTYDGVAGDLLIKMIFEEEANSVEGVATALEAWKTATDDDLGGRSFEDLFEDWAITMYKDLEGSDRFDLRALDLGTVDSGGWTIDIANEQFWDDRGRYIGATPEAREKHGKSMNIPDPTALPYGVSYETWRNPGPQFTLDFTGDDVTQIAPNSGDEHFYGGAQNMSDTTLTLPKDGGNYDGATVSFSTWYFIEEGWDYGFVEALVDGEWQTVPLQNADGEIVTTDEDPHGNNEEGNGLTGTSGGTYFVDEPQYIELSGDLPAGTTQVRFRYSTDAAYLDTGWFVDDIAVDDTLVAEGLLATDGWVSTDGAQDNRWAVQVLAPCELDIPEVEAIELEDGTFLYRFERGETLSFGPVDTKCANGNQGDVTVVVSNLPDPSSDLVVLDADYTLDVSGSSRGQADQAR